jgi:hypothetical protein
MQIMTTLLGYENSRVNLLSLGYLNRTENWQYNHTAWHPISKKALFFALNGLNARY